MRKIKLLTLVMALLFTFGFISESAIASDYHNHGSHKHYQGTECVTASNGDSWYMKKYYVYDHYYYHFHDEYGEVFYEEFSHEEFKYIDYDNTGERCG
jgi:hypothetical protein